jgi:lipopolysaccharide export system protein LptC
MSDVAISMRSQRRHWAAPGSAHDRLVAVLRIILPAAVGVVAALMVFLPLTVGGDVSFVLDKNKVEVAKERLRVDSADYRGQDDKGQPFTVTARSAVQKSSADPNVQISDLTAKIQLTDGPATVRAPSGKFNLTSQQLAVDGPIAVDGPDGYQLQTRGATMDLKNRTMNGTGGIDGTVRQGTFSADRMEADLDNRVVRLNGHVRLRIAPRRAK